jgi:hypothetical protein
MTARIGCGEGTRMLWEALLKFSFQGRPRYANAPIFVERTEAALELGFLRTGQGKLQVFETIPKLRDERQAPRGCQTNDLIRGQHFHDFQPTKKKAGEQALRKNTPEALLAKFIHLSLYLTKIDNVCHSRYREVWSDLR